MLVVMFAAWQCYSWYLLGRRFGGPSCWSGWYGKEKMIMLGIRFWYHSCSPCSLIVVLTVLSKLLLKIGTWYNNYRTVFIGGLCNNVKFLHCLFVNQSYTHYSAKHMCYPWLLPLESDFAMLMINFEMLHVGLLCEDKYNIMNIYFEECFLIYDVCAGFRPVNLLFMFAVRKRIRYVTFLFQAQGKSCVHQSCFTVNWLLFWRKEVFLISTVARNGHFRSFVRYLPILWMKLQRICWQSKLHMCKWFDSFDVELHLFSR
jgi:hypothetical protein